MLSRPSINTSMTPLEWAMLVALSVLWGGSFFFTAIAVKELPALTIVVCRVALAALALMLIMRIMGIKMPSDARIWRAFLGMGLLNNVVPFSLFAWGQTSIASGVASILNATTPLFTVMVAHGLTRDEKATSGRIVGVILGFIGVAIMIGGDAAMRAMGIDIWAQLACLAAALSYAFAGVYGRRFKAMEITPVATATGQVTASSIMLVPLMLFVDQPWTLPAPSLETIAALVGIAVLSTALAYILYFRVLSTAGATNLLLVTFLVPISAILLGIGLLGEVLHARHLAGMAMIGAGLAAIDGRLWTMIRHRGQLAADVNDSKIQ